MTRTCLRCLAAGMTFAIAVPLVAQDAATEPNAPQAPAYPHPSVYPVSWQFDFKHSIPQRIVVNLPGEANPRAFWYMTYRVTNNTDRERMFLPVFELVTNEVQVIPSDRGIPPEVFQTIVRREKNRFLQPHAQIGGELLLGEDQAKDGVAIWPEPMAEMGHFNIFVQGLSGETAQITIGEQTFTLRKQLKLDFHVRGDAIRPGEDPIDPVVEEWVMR